MNIEHHKEATLLVSIALGAWKGLRKGQERLPSVVYEYHHAILTGAKNASSCPSRTRSTMSKQIAAAAAMHIHLQPQKRPEKAAFF